MKIRTMIPILAISGAFAASTGLAADSVRYNQDSASSGASARQAPAARLVKLDAGARAVVVRAGETVNFARGDRQFTYRFDAQAAAPFEIPLSHIAPQGFDSGSVRVYVNPDPRQLPIG